ATRRAGSRTAASALRRTTRPPPRRSAALSRVSSGVQADLLNQPVVPIEVGLLGEAVSRVVPEKLLGLRRGVVQQLRVGLGHELVLSSVLQQQRSPLRKPDEPDRLDGYHLAKPGGTCRAGQGR